MKSKNELRRVSSSASHEEYYDAPEYTHPDISNSEISPHQVNHFQPFFRLS